MDEMFQYTGTELDSLSITENYRKWIFRFFEPSFGSRILEVGAGVGNFSSLMVEKLPDSTFHLLEPSENLFTQLELRFKGNASVGLLNSYLADLHDPDEYDSVVSINVLEHIQHDERELQAMHRVLKRGGYLMLFVPALQSLYGKFDASIGHFRRYQKKDLSEKLRKNGFDIQDLQFFDLAGMFIWFVRFRLFRFATLPKRSSLALYDRYLVRILAHAESRVHIPLGKNLICVAKKV